MTFFFHQLKNFIQNDPLSDWLSHVHRVFKCFEQDERSTFQEEIDEKEELIKTKDKIIRDMKEMALKMVRFE